MTREEALNILHNASVYHPDYLDALNMAIKALEQETVSKECYDHEYFLRKEFEIKIAKLEQAFDKLRAEIETKYGHCDICEYFEDYDYEENAISEYRPIGDIADILQIIDKYKAESEDKHDTDK